MVNFLVLSFLITASNINVLLLSEEMNPHTIVRRVTEDTSTVVDQQQDPDTSGEKASNNSEQILASTINQLSEGIPSQGSLPFKGTKNNSPLMNFLALLKKKAQKGKEKNIGANKEPTLDTPFFLKASLFPLEKNLLIKGKPTQKAMSHHHSTIAKSILNPYPQPNLPLLTKERYEQPPLKNLERFSRTYLPPPLVYTKIKSSLLPAYQAIHHTPTGRVDNVSMSLIPRENRVLLGPFRAHVNIENAILIPPLEKDLETSYEALDDLKENRVLLGPFRAHVNVENTILIPPLEEEIFLGAPYEALGDSLEEKKEQEVFTIPPPPPVPTTEMLKEVRLSSTDAESHQEDSTFLPELPYPTPTFKKMRYQSMDEDTMSHLTRSLQILRRSVGDSFDESDLSGDTSEASLEDDEEDSDTTDFSITESNPKKQYRKSAPPLLLTSMEGSLDTILWTRIATAVDHANQLRSHTESNDFPGSTVFTNPRKEKKWEVDVEDSELPDKHDDAFAAMASSTTARRGDPKSNTLKQDSQEVKNDSPSPKTQPLSPTLTLSPIPRRKNFSIIRSFKGNLSQTKDATRALHNSPYKHRSTQELASLFGGIQKRVSIQQPLRQDNSGSQSGPLPRKEERSTLRKTPLALDKGSPDEIPSYDSSPPPPHKNTPLPRAEDKEPYFS